MRVIQGNPPDAFIGISGPTALVVPLTFGLADVLSANAELDVTIAPYLLSAATYPPVYVGERLYLRLDSLVRDPTLSVALGFDPSDGARWISYDSSTRTLSGTVPTDRNYSSVAVVITASHPDTPLTATCTIPVLITSHGPLLSRGTITLVVILSIFGTLLLICITYLVSVRCFGMPAPKPSKPTSRGSRRSTTSTKLGATNMAATITADTLVGSPDPLVTGENTQGWWKLGGWAEERRKSKSSIARQSSGSRTRSASQTHETTPPVTPKPEFMRRPGRLRTHSSPEISLRNLGRPSGDLTMAGPSSTPVLDPELWGPPVPHPPHGLSPVELKEWVDNFVCEWAEAYGSSNSKDVKRKRQSIGDRTTLQGGTLGSWDQMDSAPGPSSTISSPSPMDASSSNVSSPTQVPVAVIPPELMHVPHQNGMRRSVSYPNTIDTFASSAGPSDMSSVASWDSLDSWELERRQHYEEPRRRNDFMPLPSVRLVAPRHRSRERNLGSANPEVTTVYQTRSTNERPSTEEDYARPNGGDEVPSIVVTAFGDTKQFSADIMDAVGEMEMSTSDGSASKGGQDEVRTIEGRCVAPASAETRRPLPVESSEEVTPPADEDADEEDEAVVFFPRPIGAELPGTGLARSPHIEGLSRFSVGGTGRL